MSKPQPIADLSSKAEIDGFWESVGKAAPDVLVNNAGVYPFCDFLDTDEDLANTVKNLKLSRVFHQCGGKGMAPKNNRTRF